MGDQDITENHIPTSVLKSDEEAYHPDDFVFDEEYISPEDKLWAAIGYLLPIFAIIALYNTGKRERHFIHYHAIQAISFGIILWVIIFLVSIATFLFGSVCSPLIWLLTLWPAYDSYRGNYTQIPYLSNYLKKRGWV